MTDALTRLLTGPRDRFTEEIASLLQSLAPEPEVAADVGRSVAAFVAATPTDAWDPFIDGMDERGAEYAAYPPDLAVQGLIDAFLDSLVATESTVEGLEHLDAACARSAAGGRVLLVGNHTSYADATTLTLLLRRAGRADAAGRMAVVAGPKVFTHPMRRCASAAMTSIKVAQSSRLAHNKAQLSPREVARIARRCLQIAAELMDNGSIVLLYAEGTRSRDGHMQPFLKATGRYATIPDTAVLPVAQWGAEKVMPLGTSTFHRAPVHLRFGPMIKPAQRTRPEALETIHDAIATRLPDAYRPLEGPRIL